jgi:hypothetical protein
VARSATGTAYVTANTRTPTATRQAHPGALATDIDRRRSVGQNPRLGRWTIAPLRYCTSELASPPSCKLPSCISTDEARSAIAMHGASEMATRRAFWRGRGRSCAPAAGAIRLPDAMPTRAFTPAAQSTIKKLIRTRTDRSSKDGRPVLEQPQTFRARPRADPRDGDVGKGHRGRARADGAACGGTADHGRTASGSQLLCAEPSGET